MQRQNENKQFHHLFWFQQPRDIQHAEIFESQQTSNINQMQKLEPLKLNPITKVNLQQYCQHQHVNQYLIPNKEEQNTQVSQQSRNKQSLKRRHEQMQIENMKNLKQDKQYLYSKVYRQRKKQKYKILQEENIFLKKRIKDLQGQLREQEIELNRFKFPPPQKQLTIDQLSKQLLQSSFGFFNSIKPNLKKSDKIVFTPQDQEYQIFIDAYDQRGFGGTKKMKLLNYYFNEMLQAILKDSEKYLSLLFVNSPSWDNLVPLPEYELLHNAFYDVFQLNEDLSKRLQYFVQNLYPMTFEYNKYCSDFYKAFENIKKCAQKMHKFIRQTYLSNIDIANKRMQLQKWFQFNKYGRLLRKLRSQWLQMIKSGVQLSQQDNKIGTKGTKKKKVSKQQN